ncbi:MAG: efflux RND transporter permease subunit [bacterium]
MNLIRSAIERPIAVIAAVLLVVLFGLVALQTIPIQLAPDVNRPVITINTEWFGAAPAEVEREIVNRQEEKLAGLEGVRSITGRSELGRGRITLEFKVGTNMDRALLLVANRLDQVARYPDEVDQPTLETAGSDDNAIAWFIINHLDPNDPRPVHEFGDFVDDVVKERIERVPGVGEVNVYGGSEREIHVVVDPDALARYRITVGLLADALANANISLGAGDIDEGKRRYVVRTEGELNDLGVIREVLLRGNDGGGGRVTVGDIAQVRFGHKKPGATIRMQGRASMAFNATRQTGANVIETMRGIREAVDDLSAHAVPEAGLTLRQVYDETVYINSAIELVQQNIWVGGTLAALILLLFLRSVRATVVISLAIPVSVVGAFVAMAALGRSINVISLAGLAFAVGMVVDAAIVVLENIYRHKEAGYSNARAAYLGAQQVWGAVLVSALTTVMVFIPILVMQLEAGQLFRDIAVAISVSVTLSLLVSITVIPALSQRLLREAQASTRTIRLPLVDRVAHAFAGAIIAFTDGVVRSRMRALAITVAVTAVASFGAWQLLPKLEYLPEGNRNLLFGIIIPPPGYNLETTTRIAEGIENETRHLWARDANDISADDEPPKIDRFFYVATRARTFLGAAALTPSRVAELKPILSEPVFREPGTFGFIAQPSIFGRGIGGGRRIEVDISGPNLDHVLQVANRAFGRVVALFPRAAGHEWRPLPGLELGAPEVRVIPHRLRLSDSGVTALDLARTIDAFNDGLRAAQSTVDGKLMDIVIKGDDGAVSRTQGIGSLPIVTPAGRVVPASSVADIELTAGPTEIRHRERFRTITLEVRPGQTLPLESAIDLIRDEVVAPLRVEGLPAGVKMRIAGTADKLVETSSAMAINLALSLVIVFLVMAVLFESFIYPLIILLSVPVAAAGGFAGLAALNLYTYQALDMLTMLGFVILIGIVVNNAILLVHQTLHHIRHDNKPADEAIRLATRNRIRPIFMSTLTSVFGMLPLVLFPGAGSELYRGLGSVVVGGLSLSAIITLLIVPPMMSLLLAPLESRRAKQHASAAAPEV